MPDTETGVAVALFTPEEDDWQSSDPALRQKYDQPVAPTGEYDVPRGTAPFTQQEALSTAPPPPPPVTDQQFEEDARRYQFADEQQRYEIDRRFDQYTQQKQNQDAEARYRERERQFTDPKAKEEFYKLPEVEDAIQYLKDPNAMFAKRAITDFLEKDVLKRPLVDGEYEAAKNNVIGINMAGQPKIDDNAAFGILQKRVELQKQSEEALQFAQPLVAQQVARSLMAGTPVQTGEVWDQLRKSYPEVMQGNESYLYKAVADQATAFEQKFHQYAPAVTALINYYGGQREHKDMLNATAREAQWEEIKKTLMDVPIEDVKDVTQFAISAVKTGDDMGWLRRLINQPEQFFTGTGVPEQLQAMTMRDRALYVSRARENVNGNLARVDANGKIIYMPEQYPGEPGQYQQIRPEVAAYQPLTKEQKVQALKDLDAADKLNLALSVVQKTAKEGLSVDLFKSDFLNGYPAMAERFVKGAEKQVGPMVMAGLNFPMYFSVIHAQSYEQTMYDNPHMNSDVAMGMASVEAGINWIGDNLEFKFLSGMGPAKYLMGVAEKIPAGKPLARLFTMHGLETLTELGQDFFSDLGKSAFQSIVKDINPDVDVGKIKTFQQALSDAWDEAPELAGEMFVLSAVGTGVLTFRDLTDPQRSVYNDKTLKGAGIPDNVIRDLLWETDFNHRDHMLMEALANLTPEQKNNGILYRQQEAKALKDQITAKVGAAAEDPNAPAQKEMPQATLVAVSLKDGTRAFNLISPEGDVVRENMPEDVAFREYDSYNKMLHQEQIAAEQAQTASEEQVAKNAAAEERWTHLTPEQKTTAANIIEFSYKKAETPEDQRRLALARDPKWGQPNIQLASADEPTTRAGLRAANFIRWFERTFGKSVQLVASEGGEPLRFTGLVHPSDPNTIFLDVAGNRNVLSLLGHEWSHTLETTNKGLWNDVVTQMKPLIVDWAKEMGKLPEGYDASQATPEFIANVIGDAFGNEQFWRRVSERHSGLFERMIAAIKEWFGVITDRASEYGTEAPDVIKDLGAIHNIIANAMERARQGPETVTEKFTPEQEASVKEMVSRGIPEVRARELVQKPATVTESAAQASLRAFHGGAAKGIEQWDLSKIGSGEGSIYYGYGLYYGQHIGTGQTYYKHPKNMIDVEMVGNEVFDRSNPIHVAAMFSDFYGSPTEAGGALRRYFIEDTKYNYWQQYLPDKSAVDEAVRILHSYIPGGGAATVDQIKALSESKYDSILQPKGQLYSVDLDVENQHLLDLDRQMHDQPPYVLDRLAELGYALEDPTETGDEMQRRVWDKLRRDFNLPRTKEGEVEAKRILSMDMLARGIPGNRFADRFSRGTMENALHDYYEAIIKSKADIENYSRYLTPETEAPVSAQSRFREYIKEAEQERQAAIDDLAEVEATTTRNYVMWDTSKIKNAPAGEQPSQASTRRPDDHSFGERGKRETDPNGGYIDLHETKLVEKSIDSALDEKAIPKGPLRNKIFKQLKAEIKQDILSARARNPDKPTASVKEPWSPLAVTGTKIEFTPGKPGEPDLWQGTATWRGQSYRFDEVPAGKTRDQWAHELATKVSAQFIERLQKGFADGASTKDRHGAQLIVNELEWYRDFVHKLRQEFGGSADFIADLLGAFSPRQNVHLNFRNMVDTIWGISHGKYDALFKELDAYLKADPSHTIKTWRDQGGATIRARSNALFGTNTNLGMTAALGLWRNIQEGDAPKAKNFTRNIIALAYKATIDVWAARLLDRVAEKPRIPVEVEGAVGGEHVSPWLQDKGSKKRGDVPLWVDTEKLDKSWSTEKEMHVGPEGAGGIGTRYQDFGEWVKQGLPIEMPQVSLSHKGEVQFTNGRHRFAWHRDQGHKAVQISVPADQAQAIRERFGAKPDQISEELPIKGQFAFGQDVFEHVAAQMRDPATWAGKGIPEHIVKNFENVTAADVQATNWFVEKEFWTEKNWTNDAGSGGSFMGEIESMLGTRFQVGLTQAIGNRPGWADYKPQDPEQARFIAEVRADLGKKLPEVIAMRVMDSLGMFMNDPVERTLDLEMTHGPGLEPNDLMKEVLYHAWSKSQQATHLSRVMEPEEENENARPGMEIYFKHEVPLTAIQPIMDMLGKVDINGFTAVVDQRADVGAEHLGVGGDKFLGIRFQYIPEYSGHEGDWRENAADVRKTLRDMMEKILETEAVASVRMQEYDTIVFQKGIDYDEHGYDIQVSDDPARTNTRTLGSSEATSWRRRYFDAVAAKAVRRNARDVAVEEHEREVSDRQQAGQAGAAPTGLAPPAEAPEPAPKPAAKVAPVTVTMFDPALMGFKPVEMIPDKALQTQLRKEVSTYNQLLKCLS